MKYAYQNINTCRAFIVFKLKIQLTEVIKEKSSLANI